jgi:small subunit ribosomal protein S3
LTTRLEQQFKLENAQVSVTEVTKPELNPNIMANRIAQIIERGTAFRRASLWTINTIMNAGAMGVEITISGKLRGERAHFEKHSAGTIPKSGRIADEVVRSSTNSILTKMGLVGIKLKISLKEESHPDFDILAKSQPKDVIQVENESKTESESMASNSDTKTEGKDIIDNQVKEIAVNEGKT